MGFVPCHWFVQDWGLEDRGFSSPIALAKYVWTRSMKLFSNNLTCGGLESPPDTFRPLKISWDFWSKYVLLSHEHSQQGASDSSRS